MKTTKSLGYNKKEISHVDFLYNKFILFFIILFISLTFSLATLVNYKNQFVNKTHALSDITPNSKWVNIPFSYSYQNQLENEYSFIIYLPLILKPITQYYVSKNGTNSTGESWESAWNELDQINWDVIKPGDTIFIDGGKEEMVYTSTLNVKKSGMKNLPITIQVASDLGRNGKVIIFGGRSIPLPYCGQGNYYFETNGVRQTGIHLEDVSWIEIDGQSWSGITIYGHNRNGIWFRKTTNDILIQNVEIYDNGWANYDNSKWFPDGPGVDFSGTNITFANIIIHDNGQDAFQSDGGNHNYKLKNSWLYNTRHTLEYENGTKSFNYYCAHPDGIQIYNGGDQSLFLIENTIIGPGFMQGVILGQTNVDGNWARINDVTFRNVLFTKAGGSNVMGYPNTYPNNWLLDHVTIHSLDTTDNSIFLEGSNHRVINTIVYGGNIYIKGLVEKTNNCQWLTQGTTLGIVSDPLFSRIHQYDPFSLDDYTLTPVSPCLGKGSMITSVDMLLFGFVGY